MPGKTHVSVKFDVKEIFDPKLKAALIKAITTSINNFIDNKSGGVLSTKDKSPKSYVLTASASLKADDKVKPTKLDAKISIIVIAVGGTTKGFTGSSSGSSSGIGSDVEGAAEDLLNGILQDLMPQAIKNMPKL